MHKTVLHTHAHTNYQFTHTLSLFPVSLSHTHAHQDSCEQTHTWTFFDRYAHTHATNTTRVLSARPAASRAAVTFPTASSSADSMPANVLRFGSVMVVMYGSMYDCGTWSGECTACSARVCDGQHEFALDRATRIQ